MRTQPYCRGTWAHSPCLPACRQTATPMLAHMQQKPKMLPQRRSQGREPAEQRRERPRVTLAATLHGSCRTCTTAWLLPLLRSGVRLRAQHQELSLKLSTCHREVTYLQLLGDESAILGTKGKAKRCCCPFTIYDAKHHVCRQLEADKAAIAKDLASSHGEPEQSAQPLPRTTGATQNAAKISALYHTPACQRTQEMTETIEKLRAQLLMSQRISQVLDLRFSAA